MKKELVILFAIISLFTLTGCDVYNTLYVNQPSMDETSESEEASTENTISEEDQ